MESLKYIRATSKRALKDSCLFAAKGDYAKAQELYDYYAKDVNLPDFDVAAPSTINQIADKTGTALKWLNENQTTIIDWINVVKSLIGKGGSLPQPPTAPPLPKI